jgi:hypothetical protein
VSEILDRTVDTKEAAHEAARQAYALAQALLLDGKRVKFRVGEDEDPITLKQRGFLHKAVLPQIAEQYVFPDRSRFVAEVWKEHFRQRFLGDRWVMRKIPRWDAAAGVLVVPKRATPRRERVSTEHLGIRAYSNYIDLVIDTATLELGVHFVFIDTEREAVRWVAQPRKKRSAAEAVAA